MEEADYAGSPQLFGFNSAPGMNFGMQAQPQISHSEALRQGALRTFFDPLAQGGVRVEGVGENTNERVGGGAYPLSVLRGVRNNPN